MKKILLSLSLFTVLAVHAQSDNELNRDSVVGWQYVINPPKANAVYKPVKSQYANGATYTAWQQQASDMLINWIQQSYLPRGLVMRTIAKNDERWYVDGNGPLHSYGVNFLGYSTRFANGKIDLKCCEQGQRLVAGFNDFPGTYIKGFNPGNLYFFAELAQFSTGDDEAQLSKEGIDKKVQPNLYNYRTYLDHYHDNGLQIFKIGVVVPKNGEWPFKPVLVKDAIAYIQQQIAAYPGIMQKNPYSVKEIQGALERLKPYYNEVVKLKDNINYDNSINDGNGHYLLDPRYFINGNKGNKTFPEYSILVAATQQTIDQTKTDNPLWVYFNLTPTSVTVEENLTKFDTKFGTGISHMAYSLLNNLNFDYVAKWLAQPDARKNMTYAPMKMPARATGNVFSVATTVSATASAKNKDPYTILYEDFDGYPVGEISAKKWHTAGYGFANSSLANVSGQNGKWVIIPGKFTFYPDLDIPLPQNYTVSYDIYFGPGITNKRVLHYFRLDAYDPKAKYPQPMNMGSAIDKGMNFSIAMSGETTTECKFRNGQYKEMYQEVKIPAFKEKDIAHVSVSVNGIAVSVSVNGKEVIRNDNAMPVGQTYKRIGWYCSIPNMLLGNIYIKSNSPVQNSIPKEPQFAGVVKDKNGTIPDAAAFETSDYAFTPLAKIEKMPPVNYPAGFKSAIPSSPEGSDKAVATLPTFKAPVRSSLLDALPNTVITSIAFKKNIDDLKTVVATKLNADNVSKIDNYLKAKKITTSRDIAGEAIGAWLNARPTVALYLFCKSLQADYNEMNTANNLASLLNAYGYSEKAISILQYVNSKMNGSPEVLANMAEAYYNLGDMSSALSFAEKSIARDSLNANANKVAAFVHLDKASQTNNRAEADKAVGCLKQSLRSKYDKEASDLLTKVEGNHQKMGDFSNTNFKEFPMLRRLELPAMPGDLAQARSFNEFLEKEKNALSQTSDDIRNAMHKQPETDMKQTMSKLQGNPGLGMQMVKASAIINAGAQWYSKMKSDLEQVYLQDKKELTAAYNKKINAITRKYNDRLNKLEGGEGKAGEEEEMERLKKARCEEYNKESAAYLSEVAKLTNQFAQKSELVSRTYFRDYANWMPVQLNDNSSRYFLDAQVKYISDVRKILSLYSTVEPCIYPTQQIKSDNKPVKPKPWEEEYCANFKGVIGLGAVKMNWTCNSMSVSGGEGFVGEVGLNFNDNGGFKEVTIGAGIGAEGHIGNQNVTAISAGASIMEYVTIGAGPNGSVQVTDWGISAGVAAGGNIGAAGGEANIASTNISVNGGITANGYIADALGINKK
ncbi:MAG: tetratricopeptide repeat protein [Chitinophagaceae bacterium]